MRGWLTTALLALATGARAQYCPGCVQNTATPQNAVINIGTATVRGSLDASTGTFIWLNATYLNVTNLVGNGSALTALNASALGSGTIPSARVAGAYTGITGLGVVTAGDWRGSLLTPTYGGTGANLSGVSAGAVPYFLDRGTMAYVASPAFAGVLATAGGGAAPVWVTSPTLTGQNFSAIPLTALNGGTLPHSIAVDTNSIANTNGAGVIGNISGGAAFLTVPLPISNLAGGTLPTSNAASSITVTSVQAGYYGGPTTLAQFQVGTDGRLYDAKQFNLVVYSTYIVAGALPPGVTIAAAQITSGTLANNVVASSVAASGVALGTYGAANRTLTATVGIDGRLTALSQANISLPLNQLQAGTVDTAVLIPAVSVQAGRLGPNVQASSVAATGVGPGIYGGPGTTPQLVLSADGRVMSATQFVIPNGSTNTVYNNIDNHWISSQTANANWVFNADVTAQNLIATLGFTGVGTDITLLTPANFLAGYLPGTVIASSVSVRKVGDLQLTTTGVGAGSYGSSIKAVVLTVDAQGRLTAASDTPINLSTGEISGTVQTAHGGTGNDWSAVASGGLPYFSGTGALDVLAKSINGYSLVQSGGVPAWAPTVSSAANIAGGAAGSVPYQSAANTTALLASSVNGYALVQAAGLPAWAAAVSSAANVVGGALGSIPYQSAANTTTMLASGTGVLEASGGAPGWTTTPTLTATNFSGTSGITGLGTQVQALNMGSHLINNVTDPASAQDAATKNYVDYTISNVLPTKLSARLGTTAALPANSYSNGSSGVGATLTGLGLGALTVDGVAVAVSDRILVKNEADTTHNGIYIVTTNGAGVFYVLTRTTDFNQPSEMIAGDALLVDSGTINTDAFFALIATITTIGTDPILFVQINGLNGVTAGYGLLKSGNTISADTAAVLAANTTGFNMAGPAFSVGTSTFVVAGSSIGIRTTSPKYALHNTGDEYTVGQIIAGSTLTVVGNAFSVGASTFYVIGSSIGIRTTSPNYALHNAGDSFTVGQEIVASTLTVQGNAFSVGTASFTVAGGTATVAFQMNASSFNATGTGGAYAITTATGVHILAGRIYMEAGSSGIRWADGTTSTTAASGSGGGGGGSTTPILYTDSATWTAQTSYAFKFAAARTINCTLVWTQNTAGAYLTVNMNAIADSNWQLHVQTRGSDGTITSVASDANGAAQATGSSSGVNLVGKGNNAWANMQFDSDGGISTTTVHIVSRFSSDQTVSHMVFGEIMAAYPTGPQITEIDLADNLGTFTGKIWCITGTLP